MKERQMTKKEEMEDDPYCPKCGHCGFIGCCGITEFLKKHVAGKTDCPNEAMVLNDLIQIVNEHLPDEMRQRFLKKCPKCKSDKCSGWHEIELDKK